MYTPMIMDAINAALPWVIRAYWISVTGAALVAALPLKGLQSFRQAVCATSEDLRKD